LTHNCTIYASVASIPSREKSLALTVGSLVDQVDRLNVFLNNYGTVPGFLRRDKITVETNQKHGDKGAAGKFFWHDKLTGYLLTCDDDIVYPPDYVRRVVDGIDRYNRRAVVGFHGSTFVKKQYVGGTTRHHFSGSLAKDTHVHILGTGCIGLYSSTLALSCESFPYANKTDIWLGAICQDKRVPMISLAKKSSWIRGVSHKETLWNRVRKDDSLETEIVQKYWPWRTFEP